jgi:hypothetical protein
MKFKDVKKILNEIDNAGAQQNKIELQHLYNVTTKIVTYLDKNLKSIYPNIGDIHSDKSNIIIKNGAKIFMNNKDELVSAIQQLIIAVIGSYGLKKYKINGPIKSNNDLIITLSY